MIIFYTYMSTNRIFKYLIKGFKEVQKYILYIHQQLVFYMSIIPKNNYASSPRIVQNNMS